MAFEVPRHLLSAIHSTYMHSPTQLSHDEQELAKRILHCVLCGAFWLKRKNSEPARCPVCHKRGWNRAFIQALIDAENGRRTINVKQPAQLPAHDPAQGEK